MQNETSRIGIKWTDEEDLQLKDELKNKIPYEQIALQHQRTVIGIKSRIVSSIILPLHQKGMSINHLSTEYNIEESIITKYLEKSQVYPNKNNKNPDSKMNIIIDKMTSLENRINELNGKLDMICKMNELNSKLDILLQGK